MANQTATAPPFSSCIELELSKTSAFEQIFIKLLLPVLCLLVGATWNLFSLLVFTDHAIRRTYTCLAFLSGSQMIAICCQGAYMTAVSSLKTYIWAALLNSHFFWPAFVGATSVSSILTIICTAERYISNHRKALEKGCWPKPPNDKRAQTVCAIAVGATLFLDLPQMVSINVKDNLPVCQVYRWNTEEDGWFSMYMFFRFIVFQVAFPAVLTVFTILLALSIFQETDVHQQQRNRAKKLRDRSLSTSVLFLSVVSLLSQLYLMLFSVTPDTLPWRQSGVILVSSIRRLKTYAFLILFIQHGATFLIFFSLNSKFRKVFFRRIFKRARTSLLFSREIYRDEQDSPVFIRRKISNGNAHSSRETSM